MSQSVLPTIEANVIKATLSSVHGVDVIEKQLSGYYIANEISGIYPGMMIAIEYSHWSVFREMTTSELAKALKYLAAKVKSSAFKVKKPKTPASCFYCKITRTKKKVKVPP
jgi:hypothetical protein